MKNFAMILCEILLDQCGVDVRREEAALDQIVAATRANRRNPDWCRCRAYGFLMITKRRGYGV